jgi:predicted aspartyl protease
VVKAASFSAVSGGFPSLKSQVGGNEMGMFKQTVRVSNSKEPSRFFKEEFCVDTGALYSFIPEDYLEKLGVEPSGKRSLILADGRQDTRLFGFCDFQIEGIEGNIPCPVVFAPKGSLLLLGATALENFGVSADPIEKKLKPILAVIGGFLASASGSL